MKFLHCSDLHLGRRPAGGVGEYSQKRYDDYFKAFEYGIDIALNENVKCFLVSGDLFDKKDLTPDILERAEALFTKLRNASIVPIVIEGNHDCYLGSADDSWINYLKNKNLIERPYSYYSNGNVVCNSVIVEDIEFYGLGYQGGYINESLSNLSNYLENKKNSKNVLLVHTALSNIDSLLSGTANVESIELLRDKVIYIAGGHYHKYHQYPDENPFLFVPGAPEHYDFGEHNYKKGFIIFDTDTKEYHLIPSKHRNCISVTFNIDTDNTNDFYEEFYKQANSLEITNNEDIVLCLINLTKELVIDTNVCEDYLINRGALKAFIKFVLPQDEEILSLGRMLAGVEQIEYQIISKWKYFSHFINETKSTLTKLKEYQETKNEQLFISEFDNLLNYIMNNQKNDY